jgi:hypothetical protein
VTAKRCSVKVCPFCAEEIQDAAVVCKHCGRNLEGGSEGSVTVEPKKRTGPIAAGCAIVIALCGAGYCVSLFKGTTEQTRPATPPTTTAAKPIAGKGKFRTYGYTFDTKDGTTVFLFEPALPMSDEVALGAMRHVLETDFGANLNRATQRRAGQAVRFITAGGLFDVTPVKDSKSNRVIGLAVQIPR